MNGPANSATSDDGIRWYTFGEGTQAEERFLSVTSALKVINKEGLLRWATALSADAALDELPRLVRATRTLECGHTFNRCSHDPQVTCIDCPCQQCASCVRRYLANRHYYESRRRAEEGIAVHDVAEWWALHDGELPESDPDVAPYVASFQAWLADYALTPDSWLMAEGTVINRAEQYAGTLDGILTIAADASPAAAKLAARILGVPLSQTAGNTVTVIVDFKTREKNQARLYVEHALQLAAYRNAAVVRIKGADQEEVALPDVDGAIVVQLRPDGYLCQPVVADELTYTAFLAVAAYARWMHEYGTAAISPRAFPIPVEPELTRPHQDPSPPAARRRAAKKAPGVYAAAVDMDKAVSTPARSAVLASFAGGGKLPLDDGIPF